MVSAPGIGSGLDIAGLVEQLVAAERQPVANRINLAEVRAKTELSALGKVKSSVAAFQKSLESLTKLENFQKRTVKLNNDELISVAATSAAVRGSYNVEVQQLASAQKLASQAFADIATPVGTGTLTISVAGSTSIVSIIDGANALADIADAINSSSTNPGVLATVVSADDGARLILSAAETGSANAITVAASGGDGGLSVLAYDALLPSNPMTELEPANDSVVLLDGFTVTGATNTISTAIEGVTIDLLAAEVGTQTRLTIGLDQSAANDALGNFVSAYNGLMKTIDEVTAFNAETGVAGALLGDTIIRDIEQSLRRELSSVVTQSGVSFSMLAEIGITTDLKGKLQIDTVKSAAAIADNFDAVGQLFAKEGQGIALGIDAVLTRLLDDTGSIDLREDRLNARLKELTTQRETLDERMLKVEKRYSDQFQALDILLSQLRSTSDYLTAQLANLPTPGQSTK